MLILITYDVSTLKKEGKKRLLKVAKKCVAHGQRVQNSVFECNLDWCQFIKLQDELKQIINLKEDSLRFYNIGTKYQNKVIHLGIKTSVKMEEELIL